MNKFNKVLFTCTLAGTVILSNAAYAGSHSKSKKSSMKDPIVSMDNNTVFLGCEYRK